MSDPVYDLVQGLPEASGTFAGTFGPDVDISGLLGAVPDLMPVEIDTYDQPNGAATALPGSKLMITIGERQWDLPIDHVEPMEGNRVKVWVRRPG